jgi:hypothetical protein
MGRKIILFFFCFVSPLFLLAQYDSLKPDSTRQKMGLIIFGTVGNKSNVSGFGIPGIGFYFNDHIELKASPSTGSFTTHGFSAGLKFNFLQRKNLFPGFEVSFRRLFAGKIGTDWGHGDEFVEYYVNYLIPLNPIYVEYVTGTPGTPMSSTWFEKDIYRLYEEGIGVSFVVSFYLQRPVKNK